MRLTERPPYSYRAVADFPDDGPVAVMDAHCALCARGARWIARHDKVGQFRFIPLQSDRGHALMRHYGLDPADPLSWLLIEKGEAYTSLDAIIRTGRILGGFWRGLSVFRVLPRALQDGIYGLMARNRYRVLGRGDLCAMPDPDVQARLVR